MNLQTIFIQLNNQSSLWFCKTDNLETICLPYFSLNSLLFIKDGENWDFIFFASIQILNKPISFICFFGIYLKRYIWTTLKVITWPIQDCWRVGYVWYNDFILFKGLWASLEYGSFMLFMSFVVFIFKLSN